jgi:hypothetical protein
MATGVNERIRTAGGADCSGLPLVPTLADQRFAIDVDPDAEALKAIRATGRPICLAN